MRRHTSRNERSAKRHRVALPVTTDAGVGRTRDLSTNGVYFTCKGGISVGASITFSIVLEKATAAAPLRLRCSGRVVRIETAGDKTGVAARIDSYNIEP